MVCSGESNEAILDTLANDYGTTVSQRTPFDRLFEWGLKGIRRSAEDAAVLNRHVLQLYQMPLSSAEVLRVLEMQGRAICSKPLQRIRKRLDICRRCDDPIARARLADEIREIPLVEDAVREIEGFGRRLQYVFLRSQSVFFLRDLISEVYR